MEQPIVNTGQSVRRVNYKDEMWEVVAQTSAQWMFIVQCDETGKVTKWCHLNLGEDGKANFFSIIQGQHSPILLKESDRAIKAPSRLAYIRPGGDGYIPDQKIAGMILKRGGKTVRRFSLTHAHLQGLSFRLTDDGVLYLGEEVFYLTALVMADKNRMQNYDAFFSSELPEHPVIIVYELEDLI